MTYNVIVSEHAADDIEGIREYITVELCNPMAAEGLVDRILSDIASLDAMPSRFKRYEGHTSVPNVHEMTVENYRVLYSINRKRAEVWVLRILYAGRDDRAIMKNMV